MWDKKTAIFELVKQRADRYVIKEKGWQRRPPGATHTFEG
jgi:hypothetical protein